MQCGFLLGCSSQPSQPLPRLSAQHPIVSNKSVHARWTRVPMSIFTECSHMTVFCHDRLLQRQNATQTADCCYSSGFLKAQETRLPIILSGWHLKCTRRVRASAAGEYGLTAVKPQAAIFYWREAFWRDNLALPTPIPSLRLANTEVTWSIFSFSWQRGGTLAPS